jgi:8-oxo-dGTP diphosphatase
MKAIPKRSRPEAERHDADEERFLERYQPQDFPRPSVTVDLVVFTVLDRLLHVLLVRRGEHPFKGRWALPGGFVRVNDDRTDQGEDLDAAAHRELLEETGLSHTASGNVFLDQVRTFGRPGRDPRMRVISVAYYALVRPTLVPLIRAGGDVSHAKWFDVGELALPGTAGAGGGAGARPRRAAGKTAEGGPELAFDHDEILAAALDRMRADLDRTGIAFELVAETFTIQELRAVHEAIRGEPLDPGNFRKRFLRLIEDGVIEAARGKRPTVSKPASVYRFVGTA